MTASVHSGQRSKGRLALNGGPKIREDPFPAWPIFTEKDEEALLAVLRSGRWGSTMGDCVRDFERTFAAFTEASHATCVTSGTTALQIALLALGIGPGDEVIVPAYTFVATASSVLWVGALPVFADIEEDTLNVSPRSIKSVISERTKAIIPVHFAGASADMDAIMAIARDHRLAVIEDCAQAHGARWHGRHVGNNGDIGTFSFQSSKNLTSGEGGALVTNDTELHRSIWSLYNVGRVPEGAWYEHPVLGTNFRMTEFQGALLSSQATRLRDQIQTREANALYLASLLSDKGWLTPYRRDDRITTHSYHLFALHYVPALPAVTRESFMEALQAEGIPCYSGYERPLYEEAAFHHDPRVLEILQRAGRTTLYSDCRCPAAERACRESIWLSQSTLLGSRKDMDEVAAAVLKVTDHADELVS